jgi:hypothetical protein
MRAVLSVIAGVGAGASTEVLRRRARVHRMRSARRDPYHAIMGWHFCRVVRNATAPVRERPRRGLVTRYHIRGLGVRATAVQSLVPSDGSFGRSKVHRMATHWTPRVPKLPELRAAAAEHGLEVDKAIARNRWRLRKPDGSYVLTPSGSAAWWIDAALGFLRKKPPR